MKLICTFVTSILNFVHMAYVIPTDIYTLDEKTVRIFLYIFLGLAWLISFYLVLFEHRRRLFTTWYGQRAFWPLNMLIQLYFTILQIIDSRENGELLEGEKIANFVMAWMTSSVLTIYAIFKPNEFGLLNMDPLLYQSGKLSKNSRRRTVVALEDLESKLITTSIKECKIKTEKNRQVVYYHILVTVLNQTHTVRKTYQDFETLHHQLREGFPKHEYPNLDFPNFPSSSSVSTRIDDRKRALDDYLCSLCFPEYMIDVFLNFLQIESQSRAICNETHKKVMGEERKFSVSTDRGSFGASFTANYFTPRPYAKDDEQRVSSNYNFHSYITVRIPK